MDAVLLTLLRAGEYTDAIGLDLPAMERVPEKQGLSPWQIHHDDISMLTGKSRICIAKIT